ncbi:Gfo/Idh/MocA family protein [Devosia submarina]|uniref:Gfo/Idh/MocA family protein n=1 Tax=Devosia submarina TaxID=1173082 RepID=UPI001300205D|nr:Gfo/Idh/MocA family oxidoreductase [Devosia submarina]
MIGAGWYAAHNHIPALARRAEVELDGVCRLGASELERVRAHFGFRFGSEAAGPVLARKPDIVVVASPHDLHFEHARAALEGGAHVLCEKPMTLDPDQAWELVRIARARDRHLLLANGYNYLDQIDGLRQRVADGAIGRIEHVMTSFISATRDVFAGDQGLQSWQTSFFQPDRSTWQDPSRGGGFAFGQLSHSLALLFFLTGLHPVSVSANSLLHEGVDLADSATLRLSNGAVVAISGAAAMPQGNRGLMRFFLTGSEGIMVAELDRDFCEIRRHDGRNEVVAIAPGAWVYNCKGPVDALVDLALGHGQNLSPGEIGARTTATIAAMLASSQANGAAVQIASGGTK